MDIEDLIPKLIRASLDGNKRLVEEITIMIIKKIKKNNPDLAKELSSALMHSNNGITALRSIEFNSVPIDKESNYHLGLMEEPIEVDPPILPQKHIEEIQKFVKERRMSESLIKEGIMPPKSMLFVGPPGVGKSYTAKWISYELHLPLITIDLAASISSYLGRSGQNIKRIFDHARAFPSILFLDEIDAIAKRRNDESDTGELKRLVNVLLKEMESWPSSSVILGASNHPDLLDEALWRRFDKVINFEMPKDVEIHAMIRRNLIDYCNLDDGLIEILIQISKGLSNDDIQKLCVNIRRRSVTERVDPSDIAIEEFCKINLRIDRKTKKDLCVLIKKAMPDSTCRSISEITGIPSASVNRYLRERGM